MNGTAMVSAARLEQLLSSLAQHLNDASLRLEPYREGVDSWVDLVKYADGSVAVVRSGKVERRETRYDGVVDYGHVLEKEAVVSRLLRRNGVPTPDVLAVHLTPDARREPSWMLMDFVPHDEVDRLSSNCERDLGRLARLIHAIEPHGDDLGRFERIDDWRSWIRRRIVTRLVAAARYMPIPDPPSLEPLLGAALAGRPSQPRSLLHLDLRAPNLATREDRVVAIFDLANAIVGDPHLELARVRGCGLLTPAFLAGYGIDPSDLDEAALDAYELDLSALLVVVSREEIDDDDLHAGMIARTAALLRRVGAKGV
jgi:aminoglycoside phosphotransferase (APT) family kinase protein